MTDRVSHAHNRRLCACCCVAPRRIATSYTCCEPHTRSVTRSQIAVPWYQLAHAASFTHMCRQSLRRRGNAMPLNDKFDNVDRPNHYPSWAKTRNRCTGSTASSRCASNLVESLLPWCGRVLSALRVVGWSTASCNRAYFWLDDRATVKLGFDSAILHRAAA